MIFAVVLPDELERRIFSLHQPAAVGRMLQVSRASRWRLQHKARWMLAALRWAESARARCHHRAQQLAQHMGNVASVRRVFKPIPALSAQAMWRCCVILPEGEGGHVCNANVCGRSTVALWNHLHTYHAHLYTQRCALRSEPAHQRDAQTARRGTAVLDNRGSSGTRLPWCQAG